MKYDFEEMVRETMESKETPSEELNQRTIQRVQGGEAAGRHRCLRFSKAAAVVLGAVLLTGGVAFAATRLWNRDVAEDYGVAGDERAMTELNDKGFAEVPEETAGHEEPVQATDRDITVKVLQTLADEHSAYVYFEVDYGRKYDAVDKGCTELSDAGVTMPEVHFTTDSGTSLSYCGEIAKIKNDHRVTYAYELTSTRESFKNREIHMQIRKFTKDIKKADDHPLIVAKGNWSLDWKISVGTEKRIYNVDQELDLGGTHFTVKKLTVTPLSFEVEVEETDGVPLGDLIGIVGLDKEGEVKTDEKGNFKVYRYVNTGGKPEREDEIEAKLPEDRSTCILDTVSAFYLGEKMLDGSVMGMGEISHEKGVTREFGMFTKVMKLDQLTGFRVAGRYVSLADCPYETVNAFEE